MGILDGFSIEELGRIIENNPNLRGFCQGYLAETKLTQQAYAIPGVTKVIKIPDHDKMRGDLLITYKSISITVECKSIKTDSVKQFIDGTWEGKVSVKGTDLKTVIFPDGSKLRTNALMRNKFDILAISYYPVFKQWQSVFMLSDSLPHPKSKNYTNHQKQHLIRTEFRVNPKFTPGIIFNLADILEQVYVKKTGFASVSNPFMTFSAIAQIAPITGCATTKLAIAEWPLNS